MYGKIGALVVEFQSLIGGKKSLLLGWWNEFFMGRVDLDIVPFSLNQVDAFISSAMFVMKACPWRTTILVY